MGILKVKWKMNVSEERLVNCVRCSDCQIIRETISIYGNQSFLGNLDHLNTFRAVVGVKSDRLRFKKGSKILVTVRNWVSHFELYQTFQTLNSKCNILHLHYIYSLTTIPLLILIFLPFLPPCPCDGVMIVPHFWVIRVSPWSNHCCCC